MPELRGDKQPEEIRIEDAFNIQGGEPSPQDSEDRGERADVMLRFLSSAKNIEAFNGKKFEEIFDTDKHKREFIDGLDDKEFIELLNGINGILRGKEKTEWQIDGETVELTGFAGVGYVPPDYQDKPGLLSEVLSAAKKMSEDGRDLKDVALLIASSINAIHPYSDGNGRTSRLVYLLLAQNFDLEVEKDLQEILSGHGASTKINVDPGNIQSDIEELVENEIGLNDPKVNKDHITNLFEKKDLFDIKTKTVKELADKNNDVAKFLELQTKDRRRLFVSVFKFVTSNPGLYQDKYIGKYTNRSALFIDVLLNDLNPSQIKEILGNYRNLKRGYVEKLIDCIANPDKEEYQTESDGQKISLKELFEQRMKARQEHNVEQDRIYEQEQEEKEKERKAIEDKERAIAGRFDNGEGESNVFEASEINSVKKVIAGVLKIIEEGKSFEKESHEYADYRKTEILKEVLTELSGRLGGNYPKTQEEINSYVENKKAELLKLFAQYYTIVKIIDYLDKSKVFNYRACTSRAEIVESGLRMGELISQSIYYVSQSRMSLRLKLFDINSGKVEDVVQPLMEGIFYNKHLIAPTNRRVIKVDKEGKPNEGECVFEIATPKFQKMMKGKGKKKNQYKSDVTTITEQDGIYIDVPEKAVMHSGHGVVSVIDLKK